MAKTLTTAELPWDIADIVTDAAWFLSVSASDLFVADHRHEGLREGAFSIAFEGDYDWPIRFAERCYRAARGNGLESWWPGRSLEPLSGWALGAYPAQD